jgi:cell division protein ZapE
MTTAAAPTSRPELEPASGSLLQVLRDVAQVHGFTLDPAQERAVASFRRLYDDLFHLERRQRSWLRLWSRRRRVRGIYLWGPVGTGKSFLMDEFFRLVPLEKKQRIHFHRFMQDIHHRLRALQGQPDPLKLVAADVGRETRLLCLDEFHVTDIGDAMLMRGLLEGLVEQQVVLVTTSNQQPDQLYAHGLQRAQFLPAIELIKGNLSVVALDGGSDYRLRTLTRAGVYHHPVDAARRPRSARSFPWRSGGGGRGQRQDRDRRPADRGAADRTAHDLVRLRPAVRRTARHRGLHRARAALPYGIGSWRAAVSLRPGGEPASLHLAGG